MNTPKTHAGCIFIQEAAADIQPIVVHLKCKAHYCVICFLLLLTVCNKKIQGERQVRKNLHHTLKQTLTCETSVDAEALSFHLRQRKLEESYSTHFIKYKI